MAAAVCAHQFNNVSLDASRSFKKLRLSTVNPPPPAASFVASPPPVARKKRSYFVFVEEEEDDSSLAKKVCFRDEDYVFSNVAKYDPTPTNKVEWIDLIINEMMKAKDVDDAKSRASKLYDDLLTKFAVPAADAAADDHSESGDLGFKEKVEAMSKENATLKRAVAILYKRQKDYVDGGEVKKLKELLKKYREEVTDLNVRNYGLTKHLEQALQATAVAGGYGRFVY
ncbi:OLC1v1009038C1 [Oldenlandia corymbosa var. corymbosa]|uniref:OLC1v1009038C1 n=1 Tax=Oldenlandia corymbosa var. corymbosa TaxID=529605 RepID=A0AAV1DN44_OLDCO|nr:OLC1v1009038C1 [Oldenlandia corymbosa var. corymbosa]